MNLIGGVQCYEWGSRDPSCSVHTIASQNYTQRPHQVSGGKLLQPHAEFWVGTHVNCPSRIKTTGELLSDYLAKNPKVLGQKVLDRFGTDLPFLLKILSVSKPLSIQAHPNKEHAEELHAKFPDIYKDPNHKPEMIVTISEFRLLRGFRPIKDIQQYLKMVPELGAVLGVSVTSELEQCDPENGFDVLKKAYRALMTAPDDIVRQALANILSRVTSLDEASRESCLGELLEMVHGHFPGDVGCLSLYFLQDYTFEPGSVVFLPANQIHAYLSGECVELMACSDNVVRGGLTPKLKDVETLCAMLNYEPIERTSSLDRIPLAENCFQYVPHGIQDFSLIHIRVREGDARVTIPNNECCSVLLALGPAKCCLEGEPGGELKRGQVLFLSCDDVISFSPSPWQDPEDTSDIFIAQVNL